MNIKQTVFNYLDKHPGATVKELRSALPDINQSSVSAYHSQWKKENGIRGNRKGRPAVSAPDSPAAETSGRELIKALKSTVKAQQQTIEAMKMQNAALKQKQSDIMAEIEGLSEEQQEEIQQIMSIFIMGMRKL